MSQPATASAPSSSESSHSGRFTQQERQAFVEAILRDGYCILPQHFSQAKLRDWQSSFSKLLHDRIADGTASERGANRYYISLPFEMPYADPEFYEDPDILAILEQAAGGEIVMPELATDTPLKDSEYQVIHRDITLISPDLPTADPAVPFQFGVNFALVDITLENGPFEIAPGTHRLTDQQSRQHIKAGVIEPQLIPLLMRVGDVMLRDVRALHRGTPNSTDVPRPMVVMGFNRVEHRRPQLRIFIPRQTHEQLSDRARLLLRLNPVVDSLDQAERSETYSNLYFLEEED